MTAAVQKRTGKLVVRIGQSFAMGEVLHMVRLHEAVEAGDLALAQRLLREPMGLRLRRKFLASRKRCREELAAAEQAIPFEPVSKEAV